VSEKEERPGLPQLHVKPEEQSTQKMQNVPFKEQDRPLICAIALHLGVWGVCVCVCVCVCVYLCVREYENVQVCECMREVCVSGYEL
jgi:hypothetical protein